ncbi:hypothetical protein BDZ89DRAFT_1034233 [Hymenopellis radicata]|nr:hypothetical protein BDZ89DRAFT_1034233 [Hymenopellis radicata]
MVEEDGENGGQKQVNKSSVGGASPVMNTPADAHSDRPECASALQDKSGTFALDHHVCKRVNMSAVAKFLDLEALDEEFEDDDANLGDEDVFEDFIAADENISSSAPAQVLPASTGLFGAKGRLFRQFAAIEDHYDSSTSSLPSAHTQDESDPNPRETPNDPDGDDPIDHHWTDTTRICDDISALAENAVKLTYTLLLYSFNQSGTARNVQHRLIALRDEAQEKAFDVVDSWLIKIAQRTKLYILLDLHPPRHSPRDTYSISQFEQFLHSHFPSINTSSRLAINDLHEKQAALRCRTPSYTNWAAKWVTIRAGKYDGDVGFAITGDSYYDVLILPRIDASEYTTVLNSNGKRIRTSFHHRPSPSLLQYEGLSLKRHIKGPSIMSYTERGFVDSVYAIYDSLPNKRFLDDLQVVKCRRETLCEALHIHPHSHALFLQSTSQYIHRPNIPYPAAWRLFKNDLVEFPTSAVADEEEEPDDPLPTSPITLRGRIFDIYEDTVEIELEPQFEDWSMMEVWSNKVVKCLDLNEFVTVQLSEEKVIGGWIMAKSPRTMDIFLQDSFQDTYIAKMMTAYRNACRRVEHSDDLRYAVGLRTGQSPEKHPQVNPDMLPSPLPKPVHSSSYYTGSAPWLGTNIVITHGIHKGRRANVVDVELSEKDDSGLLIQCVLYGQTTQGSPTLSIGYTHVVDERTGWPLRVALPLSNAQSDRGFRGNEPYFVREIKTSWQTRIDSRPPPTISSDLNSPLDASDVHWLLLPCLIDRDVEVVWTNSKAKRPRPFVVRPVRYGSSVEVRIREKAGCNGKAVPATNLSPKHPGRKADKLNRWMCIRGYYKGTFWRGLQFHSAASAGVDNDKVIRKAQWSAFQVEVVPGEKDRDLNVQELILDEDLVALVDSMHERSLNEEYGTRRVGTQVKVDDPFLISVDDLA